MKWNQTTLEENEQARLYQLLHVGNEGDLDFYCAQVSSGQSVLELGCGSGRLIEALAKKNVNVVGVDCDLAKLKLAEHLCKQKNLMHCVSLIQGDMRTFHSEMKFDAVFIAYNGLYCLSSEIEQIQVIQRALSHLKPNGKLVFDGYILPDPNEYTYESDEAFEPLTLLEVEANHYVGVEEKDIHDQDAQVCSVYYRFRWEHGKVVETQIKHRYIYAYQIKEMISKISEYNTDLKIYADFNLDSQLLLTLDQPHPQDPFGFTQWVAICSLPNLA